MNRLQLKTAWSKFKLKIDQLHERQLEVLNNFAHQTELKSIEKEKNKL